MRGTIETERTGKPEKRKEKDMKRYTKKIKRTDVYNFLIDNYSNIKNLDSFLDECGTDDWFRSSESWMNSMRCVLQEFAREYDNLDEDAADEILEKYTDEFLAAFLGLVTRNKLYDLYRDWLRKDVLSMSEEDFEVHIYKREKEFEPKMENGDSDGKVDELGLCWTSFSESLMDEHFEEKHFDYCFCEKPVYDEDGDVVEYVEIGFEVI